MAVGFPDIYAPVSEKKDKKYGLQYLKAVYSEYKRGDGFYSYFYDRARRNYLYAHGIQDVEQYKELSNPSGDTSFLNMSWKVDNPMPKFLDIVLGGQINQNFEILCSAIDEVSKTIYDESKAKAYADYITKQFYKEQLEPELGVKVTQDKSEYGDSPEEIELYFNLSFKHNHEVALEECVRAVEYMNRWKRDIERSLRWNLYTQSIAGTRIYMDGNKIKLKSVDPRYLVIPRTSKLGLLDDLPYTGELMCVTIAELNRLANGELSKSQLIEIAKEKGKAPSNSGRSLFSNGYEDLSFYNDYTVDILFCEFKTVDFYNYEKKTKDNGRYYVNKRKGTEVYDTENKKNLGFDAVCYYAGYFIVDTEIIFGYGKVKNMLVPKSAIEDAKSQYTIYRHAEQSLVERCIPKLDAIAISDLKLQQLKMSLKAKGIAINQDALLAASYNNGTKDLSPKDLIDMYWQTGVMIYSHKLTDGTPGTNRPIEAIDTSIATELSSIREMYLFEMQAIRDLIGVNELSDASTPDNRTGLGVQRNAIQLTNTALRSHNESYLDIYEETARKISITINNIAKFEGAFKAIGNIVGEYNKKTLEFTQGDADFDYGIMAEAMPTDEDKQYLEQNIEIGLGTGDITIDDAIYIRQIGKRNVKVANDILVNRRKKKLEEAAQQAQAAAEANSQQQMMSNEQAIMNQIRLEEEKRKTLMLQSELKKQEIIVKAQADAELKQLESDNRIEETAIENSNGKEEEESS